ncbi:MAG: YqgE/AlgH family protein [Chitinophagales bacterium]
MCGKIHQAPQLAIASLYWRSIMWDYRKEIRKPLNAGSLLLSEPFLQDSEFARSVSLLCFHDKQEGSMGFILNRPLKVELHEVLDIETPHSFPLYSGGPVAQDTLLFIHKDLPAIEGTMPIANGWQYGGSHEQLLAALQEESTDPKCVRLFLGYSGWDAGQLRKEIIENSWIVNHLNSINPLVYSTSEMWKSVMLSMGDPYESMANMPIDPSLN